MYNIKYKKRIGISFRILSGGNGLVVRSIYFNPKQKKVEFLNTAILCFLNIYTCIQSSYPKGKSNIGHGKFCVIIFHHYHINLNKIIS